MKNVIHVFYDNKIKTATLSGGSWTLPLANLKTSKLKQVSRSNGVTTDSTQFNVALSTASPIKGLMLGPTNLTPNAMVKVTKYTNSNFTGEEWTTGWLSASYTRYAFGEMPWGTAYLYPGFILNQYLDRQPWAIITFDERVSGLYWKVEIDDTANPAGYVDIGLAFFSDAFAVNRSYDYSSGGLSLLDQSFSSETLGGTKVFWRRKNKRKWQCQISYLKNSEAFRSYLHMINLAGYDDEIFVIPDPSSEYIQERSFLGTFTQIDSVSQPLPDRVNVGFSVEEII